MSIFSWAKNKAKAAAAAVAKAAKAIAKKAKEIAAAIAKKAKEIAAAIAKKAKEIAAAIAKKAKEIAAAIAKKAKEIAAAIAKAFVAAVGIFVSVSRSIIHFFAGIPDIVLGGFGVFPEKKLRLKVVILQEEEDYKSLYYKVEELINFAAEILKKEANVKLVAADKSFISTFSGHVPPEVLDVGCDERAFQEDLGSVGLFFRRNSASGFLWRHPITAFIVNSVENKAGCSLGPLTDYVTISAKKGLVDSTTKKALRTLAHEISHASNLPHHDDANNLMTTPGSGTFLLRWQKILLRSSRHVSYV